MKFDKKSAFTAAFSVVTDIGIVEAILAAIIVGAIVATIIHIIWK